MRKIIETNWSNKLAYVIGLFTSDGCLCSDGRHLNFTSKDKEQVQNFINCLKLQNTISKKARGGEMAKKYYQVQFGNVRFYKYLTSLGLTPRKSKTLGELDMPYKFFADFLRGLFDGDGTFGVFKHPESRHPQIRVKFASASPAFLRWLKLEINRRLRTKGYVTKGNRVEYLEYAKQDTFKILKFMYHSPCTVFLGRKFEKVKPFLRT